jgi:hypothetical protein
MISCHLQGSKQFLAVLKPKKEKMRFIALPGPLCAFVG